MTGSRPAKNPKALRVGARLGKYKLTRRIGRGAFAQVYAAYDTIEHRHVALKIPNTNSDEELGFALHEARLLGRFDHPNILCLRCADFIDDHFVMTFPLGEQSLEDRIRYRIGSARVLEYTEQLLKGLAYAHERRVIHRDIKPANVILFSQHHLRISDFGVAHESTKTRQGTSVGTLGYMSPEQGMGRTSRRADVFSMGLLLYRLSTGRMFEWPFEWPGPGKERLRRWPAAWREFLEKSLQIQERKRFADGSRMLAAFERAAPKVRRGLKR